MAAPWENYQTSSGPWAKYSSDGPWAKYAEPASSGPWETYHDRVPFQAPPEALHDRPPIPDFDAQNKARNEKLWASVTPAQLKPADLLEMAASNPALPVGARLLAGIPDVLAKHGMSVVDQLRQTAENQQLGLPVTPQDIAPATAMLPGTLERARGAPRPEIAKPRVEPPPLDAARARTAGEQAVGKALTEEAAKPEEAKRPAASLPATPKKDLRQEIEKAYLASTEGGKYNRRALLSDVRKRLSGFDPKEVDTELHKMQKEEGVNLLSMDNRQELSKRPDVAQGALNVGGEPRHILWMEKPKRQAQSVGAAASREGPPPIKLPDKGLNEIVTKVSDELYRTKTRHQNNLREMLQAAVALPKEAKRLSEKFFRFLDPGEKPTLSQDEKYIFDETLKPWLDDTRQLYEEIKGLGYEKFLKGHDPDYIHHMVAGRTPEFDDDIGEVSRDKKMIAPFGSKLPRTTRSLKASKYYTLTDGKNRQVVMLDDKGNLYRMMDKKPYPIPSFDIKGDVEPGETITVDGKKWTIGRASVAEKEAATNNKYHKDAYLSAMSNVVRLQKVAESLAIFKRLQNDPEFLQFAKGPGKQAPGHYEPTVLPGWEGWKFEPRIAETLDDFANKPGKKWYENAKDLVHKTVSSLFLLPFRHMANTAGIYYMARGWGWLPHGWLPFVKHTGYALWDTLKQGDYTGRMLDAGASLQAPGVFNANPNKQLLKALGSNFEKNAKDWKWLFDELKVAPRNIYNTWLNSSSKAMWVFSDVLLQSLVRERVAQGMSFEEAIKSAEKYMPNYRINPRVMFKEGKLGENVGRPLSQFLQNNIFSVFGRWNNNKWRAVANMVNDIARGSGKDRTEAVGVALALASLVYFVYWPIDDAVKKLSGRKDRRSSPFGPVDVVDKLKQFGELTMPETMKRLGATDSQVQATQLLQSMAEFSPMIEEGVTQLTGHNPFTNEPVQTLGERGQSLAEHFAPLQIASDLASDKYSLIEEALKQTVGERKVPYPPPKRVMTEMENAQENRRATEPYNLGITNIQRKLRPYSPDAIVNRFLP